MSASGAEAGLEEIRRREGLWVTDEDGNPKWLAPDDGSSPSITPVMPDGRERRRRVTAMKSPNDEKAADHTTGEGTPTKTPNHPEKRRTTPRARIAALYRRLAGGEPNP